MTDKRSQSMKSMHALGLLLAVLAAGACKQADAPAPPPAPTEPPETQVETETETRRPGAGLAWQAFGTEPFWGVRAEGADLRFTTPEDLDGQIFTATPTIQADGMHYRGTLGGEVASLHLRSGECSDGMSDEHHEWVAEFRLGSTVYRGCARALP